MLVKKPREAHNALPMSVLQVQDAPKHRAQEVARRNGDAQFAAAVARNEFGRFYWKSARSETRAKKRPDTSKRNGKS
jgi:hypothetical protein